MFKIVRASDLWKDKPIENNLLVDSTDDDIPDEVCVGIGVKTENFVHIDYATIPNISIWGTNKMIEEYVMMERTSQRLEAIFSEMARISRPKLRKESKGGGGP